LAFSIAFLALFPSDQRATAQDGYNGDAFTGQMAAQTPDWLYEGLKAPPRYLRAQEAIDRRWAARYGNSQPTAPLSQAAPTSPSWVVVPSVAVPSVQDANRPDAWRYVLSGGYWWYYTPNQTWLIYRNNAWATYQAAAR